VMLLTASIRLTVVHSEASPTYPPSPGKCQIIRKRLCTQMAPKAPMKPTGKERRDLPTRTRAPRAGLAAGARWNAKGSGALVRWRKSDTRRVPVPDSLRASAAELAKKDRTAKVLGLEYGKLKRLAGLRRTCRTQ
jgi:hypothetical protein